MNKLEHTKEESVTAHTLLDKTVLNDYASDLTHQYGQARKTIDNIKDGDTSNFIDVPRLDKDTSGLTKSPKNQELGSERDLHMSDPFIDGLKSAGSPKTAIDKMAGSAEYKDAEEFHKKFGNNPNSPEAIAWIEHKIQEQSTKEAKEEEEKAERRGLAAVGEPGYFYAQALLLHIAARHPNFNPNNVHGSYFSFDSGWKGMQGFFSAH